MCLVIYGRFSLEWDGGRGGGECDCSGLYFLTLVLYLASHKEKVCHSKHGVTWQHQPSPANAVKRQRIKLSMELLT